MQSESDNVYEYFESSEINESQDKLVNIQPAVNFNNYRLNLTAEEDDDSIEINNFNSNTKDNRISNENEQVETEGNKEDVDIN